MPERPEYLHAHRFVEQKGARRTLLSDLPRAYPPQERISRFALFQHRVETVRDILGAAHGFLTRDERIVNQPANLWVKEAAAETPRSRVGETPNLLTDE